MIDKIVKNKMIDKLLDPVFNNSIKNIKTIKTAIKHMVSETDLDMLMYILCDDKYKHLNKGDIVTWKPEKWEVKDQFEMDRMIDAGLMVDGYLFGKVTNSSDYKDEFNPFYYEMKLDVFLIGEDGNLVSYEMNVKTLKLSKSKLPEIWKNTTENLE
tara:strand:- start:2428 stop:2895 length:468 start_codon:yes stop_codon:yes gene_type:complete